MISEHNNTVFRGPLYNLYFIDSLFSLLRQEKKWKTSFSPGKEAHRRNEQAHPLELNIQSTDIQNKKMFEICVLQFYYLHKITKDKLKVLAGLNHVVPFLSNHLETFAMRYGTSAYYLVHLFIKSNSEVFYIASCYFAKFH